MCVCLWGEERRGGINEDKVCVRAFVGYVGEWSVTKTHSHTWMETEPRSAQSWNCPLGSLEGYGSVLNLCTVRAFVCHR